MRYCGNGQFFMRYYGNFNLELRYCGILQTCGMRFLYVLVDDFRYKNVSFTFHSRQGIHQLYRLTIKLRYFPIFFAVLRYLSNFFAVMQCSATPNVPLLNVRVKRTQPGPPNVFLANHKTSSEQKNWTSFISGPITVSGKFNC